MTKLNHASKKTDHKEDTYVLMTMKQASRGKAVSLHRYWKGIAARILNKDARKRYLIAMIDAIQSEKEYAHRPKKGHVDTSAENS